MALCRADKIVHFISCHICLENCLRNLFVKEPFYVKEPFHIKEPSIGSLTTHQFEKVP